MPVWLPVVHQAVTRGLRFRYVEVGAQERQHETDPQEPNHPPHFLHSVSMVVGEEHLY